MDANEPAFEPDAYDAVVAIESIFHMDREKVFAAAYGALQPGGTFAFCDIYPLEGGIVHSRSGEHTFVSLNQTVRLLRKQGFRNIRLIDWTDRTLPNYTERFGFFVGLASYALEANYSIEQMFDAASSFMQRPLNDAIKTELVAEVLAQTRGQSKANPPFGYFFVAASRPHAA
jgi:SAM-dependent methyltransferase